MKLDVDRVADATVTAQFSQLVANQVGQLMEVLGIREMKADVVDGGSTRVAVVNGISTFDFAPDKVASAAVCAASDLARVMAAVGIVRLSISGMSDRDRDSLLDAWSKSGMSEDRRGARLAPPPDLSPDMEPVEIDL